MNLIQVKIIQICETGGTRMAFFKEMWKKIRNAIKKSMFMFLKDYLNYIFHVNVFIIIIFKLLKYIFLFYI